ncbi:MAG: heme ABC transporter ATP-binding protein CcmA [Coxiella sp. (in: Bacteria)]|nr:MAG: heme ABC transporter ATP-binding protein CcmA [Coxiella sp. (in: g-proteobacteria)]
MVDMDDQIVLDLTNLGCCRGEQALFSGLHYSLAQGKLLQIVGPNGAGKTSLLRMLLGLLKPTTGQVIWHNEALLYIGHSNAVKPELTVFENLKFQFLLPNVRRATCRDVLCRLQLDTYMDTVCRQLSQGQQQKVALARLFMTDAKIWILDEPLTALDRQAVEILQTFFLEQLNKGITIIMTTHRPLSLADLPVLTLDLTQFQSEVVSC